MVLHNNSISESYDACEIINEENSYRFICRKQDSAFWRCKLTLLIDDIIMKNCKGSDYMNNETYHDKITKIKKLVDKRNTIEIEKYNAIEKLLFEKDSSLLEKIENLSEEIDKINLEILEIEKSLDIANVFSK